MMTQPPATLSDRQFDFIQDLVTKQLSHTSVKALPSKKQVQACVQLFHEGATIPFIARYRKERTDRLDEVQLRALDLALKALESLETRRNAILKRLQERQQEGSSIPSSVIAAIRSAQSLPLLEELYTPYKSKRLSKADQARNAGLDKLVKLVMNQQNWQSLAKSFIDQSFPTMSAIKEGLIELLADHLATMPQARTRCLDILKIHLEISTKRKRGVDPESLYVDYYKFSNKLRYLRAHQTLAIRRGDKAGVLSLKFQAEDEPLRAWLLRALCPSLSHQARHPHFDLLVQARDRAYEQRLLPSVARSLWNDTLKEAEERSANVFSENLKSLLLSPPLLKKRILGLDPGLRTGCKLAIIDEQGAVLKVSICYTHDRRQQEAPYIISQLVDQYSVHAIAIGNGTGRHKAEQVVVEALSIGQQLAQYTVVDEAGASVYSASDLARQELPHLDVSERGAVSIARRLQDPLAELIKIDPQSVGVGMYQHDLSNAVLQDRLSGVIVDAVSSIGVDLNTSSPQLLSHIAGLGPSLAQKIVAYRNENGAFPNRKSLLKVRGLGAKTFEQCAGFLRIYGGDEPLDETAVHPEGYAFTKAVLEHFKLKRPSAELAKLLHTQKIKVQALADQHKVGALTLQDRLEALLKSGRDPRDELPPPLLRSKALSLDELESGMILSGKVRNIVDFGAFVDLGVKKDGLIHISSMQADHNGSQRVSPYTLLKVGQAVEVYIQKIDQKRGRISLVLTKSQS